MAATLFWCWFLLGLFRENAVGFTVWFYAVLLKAVVCRLLYCVLHTYFGGLNPET